MAFTEFFPTSHRDTNTTNLLIFASSNHSHNKSMTHALAARIPRRTITPSRRWTQSLASTPTIDNWNFPGNEHLAFISSEEKEFILQAFPAAAFETTNHPIDPIAYYDPNENNWGADPKEEVVLVFCAPMYSAFMRRGFATKRPVKGKKRTSTSLERGESVEFGLSASREEIVGLIQKHPSHLGGYVNFFASPPSRGFWDTEGNFDILPNAALNITKGWRVHQFHSSICFGAGTTPENVVEILDHIENELKRHGWRFFNYHTAVIDLR